ncbi:MAG: VOC family protein [Opitutales bacterium]
MRMLAAMTLGLMLGGALVTASAADLPPLSDTTPAGDHFPGKFIWADLFTADVAATQVFYTGLLGWEAVSIERAGKSGPHTYVILKNHGEPVAGIAHRPARLSGPASGHWVGYVSVPDVAQALARATAAGGRVLFPARDLPQRGTQAILVDPEGAELGVLHSRTGDPGEYAPDPGDWTWAELFARDPDAAGRFYAGVTGWTVLPDTRSSQPNRLVLVSGGFSRADVGPLPPGSTGRPGWLLFVRVADVKAAAAKAVQLGGRVLVPPGDTPTQYWRAVVADPAGAVIGLVQLQTTQPKAQP